MIASREDGVGPKNRLLAALSAEDAARLGPHLAAAPLPRGRVPFDAGGPRARVYFPQRGVVPVACPFEDGTAAEMATVGSEGAAAPVTPGGEATCVQFYTDKWFAPC